VPLAAASEALFQQLAASLRAGIEPLQEKVYGPLAERETVLRLRREVLAVNGLDGELPCTYVAGRRDDDLGLAGLQLWGITCAPRTPVHVRTVRCRAASGRLLEGPQGRLLHLASVRGTLPDGSLPRTPTEQAAQMLRNAEEALAEHGFSFPQVARTWIWLARLLDWYGEFNRVRTGFLRERGITGRAGELPFPASTGIQGCSGGEECLMDLLAVDGAGTALRPILASRRQQQPIAYGLSFSRGVVLSCAGEQTVFVSGTASIGGDGRTLFCWQREAQVVETLLGVASLLEEAGAGLRDVEQATLFCKDRETLVAFERVRRQLGMRRLPAIPVLADVCRPELMVEIEALARVPQAAGAPWPDPSDDPKEPLA
jgi:enamine deaminase RidA (YjgF/YER057c/UK114 family)